jgi:hypothetical protein
MSKPGPQPKGKVSAPTWEEIDSNTKPSPAKRGPLAEVATELADREVARLLVDAVVSKDTQSKSQKRYSPSTGFSPSGARPEGFSLVTLGELMARPETPVDCVVEGMLVAGTVSGLFSKPKVGKSTTARNVTLCVARGVPFLGRRTKRGLCIYLALEERPEDVTADFRAMGATGDEPILVHADAIPAAGILALICLVQERKPTLVVIDPLFRMIHVKDEKAYAETYAALGPLIDVARSVGTHVMLTHHMGKGMKMDPVDSPLGSTGIGGAVSTLIILRRSEAYRTIATVQRLGQDLPETVLAFDPESRSLSLGVERSEADALAVGEEILRFLEGAHQSKTEPEITDGVEGRTKDVRRALRKLVGQGKVTREGGGRKGNPYSYSKCSFPCSPPIPETREQESKTDFDNPGDAKVGNSFSCSHPLIGTREQAFQNPAETRENAEKMLVPASEQKRILVPGMKEGEI